MSKKAYIFILLLLGGMVSAFRAHAFFPIPIPLIGTDVANNGMDLKENITAIGEQLEQAKATYEKTKEELKSGSFGFDAIKSYAQTMKSFDLKRIVPDLKVPKQLAPYLNKADKAAEAVNKLYVNTFSEKGKHMSQIKEHNRKRTELLQMNVSTMYAHALAARVHLASERDLPDVSLEGKNTRELIQTNRALSEKLAKRWNDILFMEAQISEYKASQILTKYSLSEEEAAERGLTDDKAAEDSKKEGEGK